MIGRVDSSGRAIIEIMIATRSDVPLCAIDVWVDTGFTGDLVIPRGVVDSLVLQQSGTVDGILADGTEVLFQTYHCEIHWFGKRRMLEVVANDGEIPLLGVGLLLGKELRIDYTNLTLSLTPSPRNVQ
jgi:clan AA aspartic protease